MCVRVRESVCVGGDRGVTSTRSGIPGSGRVRIEKKGVCAEEEEEEGQKGRWYRGAGGKNKSKKEKKKGVEEEKGAGLLGKRVQIIGRMKVAGLQVTLLKSQLAAGY